MAVHFGSDLSHSAILVGLYILYIYITKMAIAMGHRPFSIFMQVRGQRVQNEGECTQAKLLIARTYKVQRTFGTVRCNDALFNTDELA